ncbi:MAG: ribose-phosphate diphosphokinase [Mycoplasmataceae bacterium]|jgi:ribose-phosphate pyrophosphokinase|nr:ribose-phosphate diphosphokinase [Mycoplasmataceae bacterium]
MANNVSKKNILIVGLSGAKKITNSICKHLNVQQVPMTISRFADGEIMVKPEVSVRYKVVTVIQSISKPVNENLMELLITIDALKRASAKIINVVIPYYAYARQDRKTLGREPITSKLVATLLERAGASRIAIIDIHSEQTQGFFDIPADALKASFITVREAINKIHCSNLVVVSPDYGGVKRARQISAILNLPLAILDKRRPTPNHAEISNILGDIKNKNCLISDDMIDTAGTMVAACKVLKDHGAKSITIAATHGILSDPATERLSKAVKNGIISDIYLTNSIESVYARKIPNLHVCDLGKYLSEIIKVYYSENGSVSTVYEHYAPRHIMK